MNELVQKACQWHVERYQVEPEHVVAAPGRVNLIGEHIDYNDGYVMPMAIERYVVMTASTNRQQNSTASARLYSNDLSETINIPLDRSLQQASGGWASYVEGVVAGFLERFGSIPAFDGVVASDVPIGGGLSSSAALEVATATMLEALTGHRMELTDKALLCQQAEHRFAGVPCGVMDQFSSVFGKPDELMLLDCRSNDITAVPFADDAMTVLIVNSCVKHNLTGGEYATRRRQCEETLAVLGSESWRDVRLADLENAQPDLTDEQFRRGRHVVTEIIRTGKAADAFANGRWSDVGHAMYASHESLRDDFEVSCQELDQLVEIARSMDASEGVIGSRMTGGGFGGCTVTLVKTENVARVQNHLLNEYKRRSGIRGEAFSSRPALGAHAIAITR
ncbi:galactokinase [Neorhodopirellula pilleata]|uniref:galactokinase n=1 Tax=Neorhodopirellula pilleata TaxID=2714738 RepID=UPI0018CE3267|nr:galactokinase [Neorhodopirellula pilleata]